MSKRKADPVGSFLASLADVATAPIRAATEVASNGKISDSTASDLVKSVGGEFRDSLAENALHSSKKD